MNQKKAKGLRKMAKAMAKMNPTKDSQSMYDKMKKNFKANGKK